MQQQINLFQPVFRREAKVFSARTLGQILALALVLIIGSVALLQLQLERHISTRNLLDSQYRALESQLKTLENQADAGQLATLDDRIKGLQSQLADGASELTEMQDLMLERSSGFAAVLEALARHPLNGLWLTGLHLQGTELEIRGLTLDPQLVPRYLAALDTDEALGRWTLAIVQIERDGDDGRLHFTLRSTAAGQPGSH